MKMKRGAFDRHELGVRGFVHGGAEERVLRESFAKIRKRGAGPENELNVEVPHHHPRFQNWTTKHLGGQTLSVNRLILSVNGELGWGEVEIIWAK